MGIFYKHFDGEPIIGSSKGDRLSLEMRNSEEWTLDYFDGIADLETRDVCELIEGAEAALLGRNEMGPIFDAAPSDAVLVAIFQDAVEECADAGVFRSIAAFHSAFRREWLLAAYDEGLEVACPSHRTFERAVEKELRRRAGARGKASPKASHRADPIFPNFGK